MISPSEAVAAGDKGKRREKRRLKERLATMSSRSYSRESLLDPTGVRFDDAFELLSHLCQFLDIGIVIQRMEVMKIAGDREVPSIDDSIIGIDGESNWSHHEDPRLMTDLARQKLSSALDAAPCSAKVWFEAVD